MEDSIFTKIINGEIPCHKIYEDDKTLAILSIAPAAAGHTLVIPKVQYENIWDMQDDDYHYLMSIVKKVGLHLREVTGKDRVGIVVKGFEVPHVHVHLIPVDTHSGVSFDPEDGLKQVDFDSLSPVAEKLRF